MDLPPPPLPLSPQTKASRPWWRLAVGVLAIGVAIGIAGAYITVPYYTLGPGPAKDVEELIHVTGSQRTYASSGEFFLTTVAVSTRPVSLFEAFVGWLDPSVSVVPRTALIRPGLTDEQQDQYNALDMEESKYSALLAALKALHISTPPIPGARVIGVAQGFPAAGKLQEGDLIVSVDGQRVRTPEDAIKPIIAKRVGSRISVEVLRGDQDLTLSLRTVASPLTQDARRPVLGVRLAPAVRLPFDVSIDSQNIGGPSAGLAFALTIADELTPEDLTRGHHVAVTGTIDPSGIVGPVGGVEFKVRAAEHEGADVFLAPSSEVAEAKHAASSHLRVIGVGTLTDAIADLRSLAFLAPGR
jgi:Lon-like protease